MTEKNTPVRTTVAGEPLSHEQGEQLIYKRGLILTGPDAYPANPKQGPGCYEMSTRPDGLHKTGGQWERQLRS